MARRNNQSVRSFSHDDLPARSGQALTAAGAPFSVDTVMDGVKMSRLKQAWWARGWHYYETVPPVHYAGTYIANALSRIRITAAKMNPEDPNDPIELTIDSTDKTDKRVAEAVAQFKNPKGGQRQILRTIGLNLFVPGEVYLIGYTRADGTQVWEAVSTDELDVNSVYDKNLMRRLSPGATPQPLPEGALTVRIWREHPRWSELSDSPLRAALDACESYIIASRTERSMALRRAAGAGLLFIPQELTPPSEQGGRNSQDPAAGNPLWDDLVESMLTPLSDEADPMNVVPMLLVGPAEYGKAIQHVKFGEDQNETTIKMKEDAVTHMATAFDIPNEVLQGHSNLNHWGSAAIRQESFAMHLQPFVELVVDALTAGYLRPALERAGIENVDDYFIWFDASELVLPPDQTEIANMARDRLLISDSSYRRKLGLSEGDAPSTDEYNRMVGLKLIDARMATTGEAAPDPVKDTAEKTKAQADVQTEAQLTMLKAQTAAQKELAAHQAETQKAVATHATSLPETPAGGRPRERTGTPAGGRGSPTSGSHAGAPQQKSERRVKPTATKPVTGSVEFGLDARSNLGYKLGEIDVATLAGIRILCESVIHRTSEKVGSVLRSKTLNLPAIRASIDGVPNSEVARAIGLDLVASAGFDEYDIIRRSLSSIDEEFAALVLDAADSSYELVSSYLAGRSAAENNPIWASFQEMFNASIGEATSSLNDRLVEIVHSYLFDPLDARTQEMAVGETDRLFVRPGDVRDILVRAGGGSADSLVQYDGGIATGRIMRDYLNAVGVPIGDERIWLYGSSPRKDNFQGHLQLSGTVFSGWDAVELSVWPEDGWIRTDHYAPGDHRGCGCITAPYIPNYGDAYEVSA